MALEHHQRSPLRKKVFYLISYAGRCDSNRANYCAAVTRRSYDLGMDRQFLTEEQCRGSATVDEL